MPINVSTYRTSAFLIRKYGLKKDCNLSLYLKQELNHLSVDKSLDWLAVDVGDEVTSP